MIHHTACMPVPPLRPRHCRRQSCSPFRQPFYSMPPYKQPYLQTRAGTTPVTKTAAAASSRGTRTRTPSSATRRAAAAADISTNTSAGLGIGAAPSPLPSPLPSAHASPHCRRKTPNATGGPAAAAKPAQPSTQADSCLEALPRGPIPPPAALVAAAGQKDVCSLSACGLFAAASMPGEGLVALQRPGPTSQDRGGVCTPPENATPLAIKCMAKTCKHDWQ